MVANIPGIPPPDMQLGHRNPQVRRARRHDFLRRRDVRHPGAPPLLLAPVRDGAAGLGGQGPRQNRRLAHDHAADGHFLVEGLRTMPPPLAAAVWLMWCSTVIGGFYVLFLLPSPRPAITDD